MDPVSRPATDPDVLVLGGGVVGLACALHLLEAGRSVRVLERDAVGAATSHGNCGTITPSHAPPLAAPGVIRRALGWMRQPDAPFYVRPRLDPALAMWLLRFAARCNGGDWRAAARAKAALLLDSRARLERWSAEGLACEFEASGLRYVFRDPNQFAAACAEREPLHELGIATRVLDAAQLEASEPALLPGVAGALEFPGDARLRPERLTDALAQRIRALGGTIDEGAEVTGFVTEGDRLAGVATARGDLRARDVVAAFGPWSPALLRQLDMRLPIQPGKGYSITYSRPALAPAVPLVLRERSVCVTAWASGFRLGSTMEFSGYDASLNRVRLDALERAAREYLREPVGPQKREEWYGWRPMTWDDLPIIGRGARWRNLWLATGHGMLGVSMSAGTGRLVADMVTGRAPAVDPAPYSPRRFRGN